MSKPLSPSFRTLKDTYLSRGLPISETRVIAELRRLNQAVNKTGNLAGKNVLDIGSGSIKNPDRFGGLRGLMIRLLSPEKAAVFEPWYCRLAHEMRANVTALDIGDNTQEEFPSIQMDVTDFDAWQQIESGSVHVANNYKCTVPRNSKHARRGTSPTLMYRLRMDFEEAYRINEFVFRQVERVLMTGGIYTLAEFVFRKEHNGKLQLRNTMDGLGS